MKDFYTIPNEIAVFNGLIATMKFIVMLRSEFTAKSLVEALKTYKSDAVAAMYVYKAETEG